MNVSTLIMRRIKKANHIVLTSLFFLFAFSTVNALATENHDLPLNTRRGDNNLVNPNAKFGRIWIDYDITEAGKKGMRIHVQFSVTGMKGIDSYLALYFETKDGKRLRDKNGKFNSTTGDVAVYRVMKPGYDPAEYNDLDVFMPYEEFDLGEGNWDLRIDVDLIYKSGGLIQHLTFKDFNYKNAAKSNTNTNTGSISAEVKRIWIDYNVTRDGKKGMLIHVNFSVTGLKGVPSKLVARVKKENDEFLVNRNLSYSNDNSELEVSYALNPGYPVTNYSDAVLFLPYSEINITKGVWSLTLDVDLNYDDGELIQHLQNYDFEFTRN